jgi:hypothetical protein
VHLHRRRHLLLLEHSQRLLLVKLFPEPLVLQGLYDLNFLLHPLVQLKFTARHRRPNIFFTKKTYRQIALCHLILQLRVQSGYHRCYLLFVPRGVFFSHYAGQSHFDVVRPYVTVTLNRKQLV